MAKKINLGKVGITTAGVYDSNKAYERLSCVTYNYESWVSTKDVPAGNTPQDGSEYWQKMAARGAQGTQGEKGEQGIQGPQGPQGNSGYTGTVGELEVVNDLTKGGATAALSAEQGKVLKQEITELSEETNARFAESAESTSKRIIALENKADNKFADVDSEIENLKRGEAYIMGETLAFRNYADATIIGNTLTL